MDQYFLVACYQFLSQLIVVVVGVIIAFWLLVWIIDIKIGKIDDDEDFMNKII